MLLTVSMLDDHIKHSERNPSEPKGQGSDSTKRLVSNGFFCVELMSAQNDFPYISYFNMA